MRCHRAFTQSGEAVLRQCLESAAPDRLGGRSTIAAIQVRRIRPAFFDTTYSLRIRRLQQVEPRR